jgi:hypothetical protein
MSRHDVCAGANLKFSGVIVSEAELALVRRIVTDYPLLSIHELSLTVCELLDWKRPNGGLKSHECRAWLQALSDSGIVSLPAVRNCGPRGPQQIDTSGPPVMRAEVCGHVSSLETLSIQVVEAGSPESRRFRQWIERYHYLGYRVPVGASLRYMVHSDAGAELACLQWSSPAWKMAPRDNWIGWSGEQRRRNLQYVVNNSRFLILPWVRVKCLASKILSLCARQLSRDWELRYGYLPLLLETLVETGRFTGVSYRAANWIRVGQTQGRGRMDRERTAAGSRKDIYLYPLCRQVQRLLQTAAAPGADRS